MIQTSHFTFSGTPESPATQMILKTNHQTKLTARARVNGALDEWTPKGFYEFKERFTL